MTPTLSPAEFLAGICKRTLAPQQVKWATPVYLKGADVRFASNDEDKTFPQIDAEANAVARAIVAGFTEEQLLAFDRAREQRKAADTLRHQEADSAQALELSRDPMGGFLGEASHG